MSKELSDALLRRKQVQEICAMARSTLWAKVRNGSFPAPLKIGPRTRAWTASSVHAWIAEQTQRLAGSAGGER